MRECARARVCVCVRERERERERDESGLRRSSSGNLDPRGERKDEGEGEVLFVRVYERVCVCVFMCARATLTPPERLVH